MNKNAKLRKTSLFLKNSKKAIKLNQDGLKLFLFGKEKEAIACFKKSIKLSFNYPDPYFHLGNYYLQINDFDLAEKYYVKAIEINPKNADYYFNLGIIKYNSNKIDETIKLYKKSLEINPNHTKSLKFLGNLYKDKKDFTKALKINSRWKNLEPNNPEPYFSDSLIHIRNGRFDIGWKLYERGLENNVREPLRGYYTEKEKIWDGRDFNSGLLVYGEQGLGDQLIFGTVLPDLLKDHQNVILKVDARLKNLFEDSYSNIKVFSENDEIPKCLYKSYISLGSLCKFYRNHTNDFLNSKFKSYDLKRNLPLHISKQISSLDNLKIGISWKTFASKNQIKRSLSTSQVSKILSSNNNSFINLQYGNVYKDIKEINSLSQNHLITIDNLDLTNDLNNVINVIKNCDLIITIDNTLAHLAASLGKITWILLPFSSDFRWMESITPSLWYDNAVLIRQKNDGVWDNVLNNIIYALSKV